MRTKQDIIDAIRQTAKENSGKPLGKGRFETETGIKPYDWGKYWARFGDAQREAGFMPNQLQSAHADEFLIGKMIGLMRKLGKFPTYGEIRVERSTDAELPDKNTFQRLGTKEQLAGKIAEYCKDKDGYADILDLCSSIPENADEQQSDGDSSPAVGEVYLIKSGRYYKTGRTNDPVRRGSELRIQLPEKMVSIHSIKTDDPPGVEAYWHRRFQAKRTETESEWFSLNSADVKAFKRWRRI